MILLFLITCLLVHTGEAHHSQALIMNSTICGPIYVQPNTGFTVSGRGQDDVLRQIDPDCGNLECVAYRCFGSLVLYGPSVVKCEVARRKWTHFPFCDVPRDDICHEPEPLEDPNYNCWKKKKRWRYEAASGRCNEVETCLRSPPLGGNTLNLFLTRTECAETCSSAAISRRSNTTPRILFQTSRITPEIHEHGNGTQKYDQSGNPYTTPGGVIDQNQPGADILGVTTQDKINIVKDHNLWRQAVYPEPNEPLAELRWDDDLAQLAANYASTCPDGEQPIEERQSPNYGTYGQSIAFSMWEDRCWDNITEFWADERLYWKYGVGAIDWYLTVDHYTQMVSQSAKAIGYVSNIFQQLLILYCLFQLC